MSDPILTRNEEVTAIISVSQALLVAHTHAGCAQLTVATAVERACILVGLAQAEESHDLVKAAATGCGSLYRNATREMEENLAIEARQRERIASFVLAMQQSSDDRAG